MATLAERAERAESVLFQKYDELNALWQKAEQEFSARHIPTLVKHVYSQPTCSQEASIDPYARCLAMVKKDGKWRICHGEYHINDPDETTDWTPITECSAVLRVHMTRWIPKLREAIVAASERFVPEVEKAIERLRAELSVEPEVSIDELLADRAKLNGRHPKK